jgi:hypothetical protein
MQLRNMEINVKRLNLGSDRRAGSVMPGPIGVASPLRLTLAIVAALLIFGALGAAIALLASSADATETIVRTETAVRTATIEPPPR